MISSKENTLISIDSFLVDESDETIADMIQNTIKKTKKALSVNVPKTTTIVF